MATSHFHQIPPLMRYIEMLWPSSILDIGAGIGRWGFLCRDRLEFLEGRYNKGSWRTRIYGIELFAGFRNPVWDYCYDRLWVADALDVMDAAPSVDVVLLADVMEHIPKSEGRRLLAKLKEKASYLLISTPVQFFTGQHDDNTSGAGHVSFWDRGDFSGYSYVTEEHGSTRFFLIDLRGRDSRHLAVEGAERYPFRTLVRALVLKTLRKLGLPSRRFVAPRAIKEELETVHRRSRAARQGRPHRSVA